MSTKALGVVGQGLGLQNSIQTIPTNTTVSTIPTIPTLWGCSKLKPLTWPRGLFSENKRGKGRRHFISFVAYITLQLSKQFSIQPPRKLGQSVQLIFNSSN